MTAQKIKAALKVRGSKVFGTVVISEHDSTYIELRKGDVYEVIKSMQEHGVGFEQWVINGGDVYIN